MTSGAPCAPAAPWRAQTVVCIIPSFGERYLSTALYENLFAEASEQQPEEVDV